jgi:hypothetical protein
MGFSGMAVAAGMTPSLQTLDPKKLLTTRTAGMLNQFAWPVSMDKIGWRTYIIFTIWCGIQSIVIFFWIPETKNRTVSHFPPLSHLFALQEKRKEADIQIARRTRRDFQLAQPRQSLARKEETRF